MATRGILYRCNLCSFLSWDHEPQTPGLDVSWTRSLEPIEDSAVLSGTLVELYSRIEDPQPPLSPESRIRFDILEEDYILTGGLDDKVDSLVGTDAAAPDEGFQLLRRETEYVSLGSNESVGDFIDYLRRNQSPQYHDRIFLIEEVGDPPVLHVLAFWEAIRREDYANSEFFFIININDDIVHRTKRVLNVAPESLPEPSLNAALEERPEQTDVDLMVMREALEAVQEEFAIEERARQSGWQPPDVAHVDSAPMADPSVVAAARREVRAAQEPPPPYIPVETELEPWPFQHPEGSAKDDSVKPGPSPFDDNAIAIMRSWDTFRPTGERYAISYDFNRAIRWGQLLFGARAFVVIEGPIVGPTPPRYYTIPTNLLFSLRASQFQTVEGGGSAFVGVDVRYWQIEQRDIDQNLYMVRLIGTTDNAIVIPNITAHREETCVQLISGCPFDARQLEPLIPHDRALQEVYSGIDEALGQDRTDDAAKMLIELNWNAFTLVPPTRRGQFLRVLLQSLTVTRRTILGNLGDRIETAIIEIVHSVRTRDELKQVMDELRGHDEIRLIVGRMDSKFWTLLTDIGERLGENVEIRIDKPFLFNLFQDSLGGNPALIGLAPRVRMRSDGSLDMQLDEIDELYTAASTFLNFGKSMIEGFATLIMHPDQVVKGVWALVKGIVMIDLAIHGVPLAVQWVNDVLIPGIKQAARGLVNAWKGAQILGDALSGDEGGKLVTNIVTRVKWAMVWEVASLFIGIGEIAGAVKTVARGVEEAAGLLRMSRTVTTGERTVGKLNRFAELAQSRIGHADDARRLLSHLPADDIRLLERTLADTEPHRFRGLDELGAHLGPEGEQVINHVMERMQALQAVETRASGTLATEGGDAFARLAGLPGASNERLTQVLGSLGDREMSNLLETAERLPSSALSGSSAIPFDTVRAISARPGSFNALAREGYDTVTAMLRHSGGDLQLMEKNFDALRILRNQASEAEGAALTSRILDGEGAALSELRNARRTLDIMRGRCLL
jgi:hypothetical protein